MILSSDRLASGTYGGHAYMSSIDLVRNGRTIPKWLTDKSIADGFLIGVIPSHATDAGGIKVSNGILTYVVREDMLDDILHYAHEATHITQYKEGRLKLSSGTIFFDGKAYDPSVLNDPEVYYTLPWEIEAYKSEHQASASTLPFTQWYDQLQYNATVAA